MKAINIDTRLAEYNMCLKFLESIKVGEDEEIGICVILGDIHCGNYFKAPWDEWHELVEYYPELKELDSPKTKRACMTNNSVLQESIDERISIIKSAIFKIKPKK